MPCAIRDVLEQAGEVRSALLNPAEAGDFTAEILRLNAAIDRMREVKACVEKTRPAEHHRAELERGLRVLREDLARLARLAGHGEAFWRGWARMIGLPAGGYTPAGLPESVGGGQAATTVVA